MMTVGSLFAGIGGFDLGLEHAGMQVKWQVEIDPYCLKVLEKHWPHVRRYTDIKTIDWSTVEPVDLVCGGFPCQPVSVAGKRKGTSDERWLWPEFVRCFSLLRPHYVLIENVPGLLTANDGLAFAEVLRDLAACGYAAEWDCIPAGAFGAHFEGNRVFVIASHPATSGLRFKGERPRPCGAWSEQQFARLVEYELSVCVPTGKMQRVSDGLPNRKHRLGAIGNSVVPQVVEWIGRQIVQAEERLTNR